MSNKKLFIFLGAIFVLLGPSMSRIHSEESFSSGISEKEIFSWRTYNPEIPSPTEFFGYSMGAYHTTYDRMIGYFQELEKKSGRILFRTYGQSWEHRPLFYAVISMEANLKKIDAIRDNLARLSDPRKLEGKNEAEAIIDSTPSVILLNYGNDGNETAAFESAIHTAYQLVSAADKETQKMLDETVVLITPALSPDSHERFVAWYNAYQVGKHGTADPNAAEHFAPWGLDTNDNHYQINLNRESIWNTQPESQAMVKLLREWNPQVFVDHHGQPEEFIGPWYVEPINAEITQKQREWLTRFGKDMSEIFKDHDFRYTPWEFGVLYPGYWDSLPLLNGAVAFTTESGGGGWKGLELLMKGGHITTLKEGIIQNVISDQSTLRVAAENRREMLKDYLKFKQSAIEESRSHKVKAYVLPASNDPERNETVVNLLLRNGVDVMKTKDSFAASGIQPVFKGSQGIRSFNTGSFLIPMAQPQARILRVLMERDSRIPEDYLNKVKEAHELSKKAGYINPNIWTTTEPFYDVTGWAVPLTYDIECYKLAQMPQISMELLTAEVRIPGQFLNSEAGLAYVFDYSSNRAVRAISWLRQQGILFHVASSPFRIGEHKFTRGAIVVFRHENSDGSLSSAMKKLVEDTGITLLGVDSNLVDEGPHMGSDQYLEVASGKIAVVMGGPIRPSSFGSIWFLCEQVYDIPFTALNFDHLRRVDLKDYNAIVFPDGFYSGIDKSVEKAIAKKLRRWVHEGGSLIGIKGASAWITKAELELTSIRTLGPYVGKSIYMTDGGHAPLPILEDEEEAGGEKDASSQEAASMEQLSVQTEPLVPGGIFLAEVDPHHYLSYGYEGDVPVLVWSNLVFSTGGDVGVAVTFAEAGEALISGFAFPESVKRLAKTPYLMDEKKGLGHVILYADDPNFRLYWDGLTRLFFNSLFFSNSF